MKDHKWGIFMGNTRSDTYDAGLHFIGQSPVIWPQLMKKATSKCQKEKKVIFVITEPFVLVINGMEGRGYGLRHGDNLKEFLRTGMKVIAVAMVVVRNLDKTIIKFSSSHIMMH